MHDPSQARPAPTEAPSPFAKRTAVAVGIAVLIVLLVLFLWYAVDVLLLAFGGVLLAILLRTLSGYLHRWTGLSERLSLAAVVLLLVIIVSVAGWLVAPSISLQLDQLSQKLPESLARLKSTATHSGWGRWLFAQEFAPQSLLPGKDLVQRTTGIVSRTIGALFSLLVLLFLALYVAAEPRLYTRGFLHLLPKNRREQGRRTLEAVEEALRRWIFATMFSMTVIGVLTWLGLWLLGVPLALTLAVIAGLLNAIPNFGPILSVVPAALLALLQSPASAGYVILLYLGIQHFETYLLTPLVQRKAVSLPPALLILSQVLMGILTGTLGVILAAPLLVTALVTIQTLYVRDTLGDKVEVAGQGDNQPGEGLSRRSKDA